MSDRLTDEQIAEGLRVAEAMRVDVERGATACPSISEWREWSIEHGLAALRELARWRLAANEQRALARVCAETWVAALRERGFSQQKVEGEGLLWLRADAKTSLEGIREQDWIGNPAGALGVIAAIDKRPRVVVLVELLEREESNGH